MSNLASRLTRSSEAVALIVGNKTVSHTELHERAARWRGALIEAGVTSGDRVAIIAGNNESFVLAHLAALGVGAISCPLNHRSPVPELRRELDALEPRVLIADESSAPVWPELDTNSTTLLLADALDAGSAAPIVDVDGDAPAALLFTSGTAGSPKPAELSHANLTASLEAVLSVPVDLIGQPHVFLAVIPLFHVFGLNTVLNLALVLGATVVLDEFASPNQIAKLVAQHRVTVIAGPPTMWQALCSTDPNALGSSTAQAPFESVSIAVSGAAKLPASVRTKTEEALGITLAEGYGLTETSAVVAASLATDAPIGSVGHLLPGVEARIVDQAGGDCLVGDPGELWVKGPMVSGRYWGHDQSTLNIEDGWLKTGDIAVVDGDGNLSIVDRMKDLVIVSGFNVFPDEVENALRSHPTVAEVGVVGEPSEQTGEKVVAYVVLSETQQSNESENIDDQLRTHCQGQLARYKVPSRFVILPELPLGPTGKVLRSQLKS